jgi:hypothetical protein
VYEFGDRIPGFTNHMACTYLVMMWRNNVRTNMFFFYFYFKLK